MKIAEHVESALADWDAGRKESALTQACIAVDGTARRMFPSDKSNKSRYKRCLRHFYWMLEPALGTGIDLEKTSFPNTPLKSNKNPDIADIIYEVFRCSHAHGDEVPVGFELVDGNADPRRWVMGNNVLRLPDSLVIALLFIAVFAPVNAKERSLPGAYLYLGPPDDRDTFPISEWWGRSADLQPIAKRHNPIRVHMIFPPGHEFLKDENGPQGTISINLRPLPRDAV